MITPLRKHVSENEERAVLQLRQKKHGLHDRAAENNDMAKLYYMNYSYTRNGSLTEKNILFFSHI